MVARAAAIFSIDKIFIFHDTAEQDQHQEISLITTILSYMETPQYLRKKLFRIRPELKYAGVLPPLRTRHHPLTKHARHLIQNEIREAIAISHTKEGTLVDIGVEQNALIRHKRIPLKTRLTVKVHSIEQLEAKIIGRSEIGRYWGYQVIRFDSTLGKLLKKHTFDLTIATSRLGRPFIQTSEELLKRWKISRKTLIAFGAPTRGLYEIVEEENLNLDKVFHFVINTIPQQEVETVRAEEAFFITLGILNLMASKA